MSMTVAKLHRFLGAMIEAGHGRKPVTVNKRTFSHPLEQDGVSILNVHSAELDWIPQGDDDGGTKVNKDGTEHGKWNVVLTGHNDA